MSLWENIPHLPIGKAPEELLDCPAPHLPMVLVKAKRALLALSEDAETDPRNGIIDAVSDLAHLARHLGFDFFDRIINSALENMREETPVREEIGAYVLTFSGTRPKALRMFVGSLRSCAEKIESHDEALESAYFSPDGSKENFELTDDERVFLGITPTIFCKVPDHTVRAAQMTLQE